MRLTRARMFLWIAWMLTMTPMKLAAIEELHVASTGDDRQPGTLAQPVATVERALERVLAARAASRDDPITLWVHGGTYELAQSLTITREHGPLTITAVPGENVRWIGGRRIAAQAWQPVSDPTVRARFAPQVVDQVRQLDLAALGVPRQEAPDYRGPGYYRKAMIELHVDGQPMTLARWPRDGFITITRVPMEQQADIGLSLGLRGHGAFFYTAQQPAKWAPSSGLMVYGFLSFPYEDGLYPVKQLDAGQRRVDLKDYPLIKSGCAVGSRFKFLNILEEITQPGDYAIDFDTQRLYCLPAASLEEREVVLTTLNEPLVVLRDAVNVTLRGITFASSRGSGVQILGGRDNTVLACTFRHLAHVAVCIGDYVQTNAGYYAPDPLRNNQGGERNGVVACDIEGTGQGGIILAAGDRASLTPGHAYAVNNDIRHYNRQVRTYGPGVMLYGVGNRAEHNRIHTAPHNAIYLHGNDHLVAFNHIANVALESGDVGAFYMGYDWTLRGVVLRHNYFHDLGRTNPADHSGSFANVGWSNAVYLDDWTSGQLVEGNIFHRVHCGIAYSGGRDAQIVNNLFVDCAYGLVMDGKGLWPGAWQGWLHKEMRQKFELVKPTQPPYSERYPELASIAAVYALPEPVPFPQVNSAILRNVSVNAPWDTTFRRFGQPIVPVDYQHNTFIDNLHTDDDAMLTHEAGTPNLRPDQERMRRGIMPLPVERIGLQVDEHRTTITPLPLVRWAIQINRMPTVATPGRVTVQAINRGEAPAEGVVTITTTSPESITFTSPAQQPYTLSPGESASFTWEVTVHDDRVAEVLFVVVTDEAGERMTPAVQAVTMQRVRELGQVMPLFEGDAVGGEVRLAVEGDDLVLVTQVRDEKLTRLENFWEGSCVQLYAAATNDPATIRQLVLLPPVGEKPLEVMLYHAGVPQPAPLLSPSFTKTPQGYDWRVRIPMALLGITPDEPFYLEVQAGVTQTPGPRATASLFAAASPFRDTTGYGLIQP